MELQHLDVKFPLAAPPAPGLDLGIFIPVFHRWIQEQSCEELLIDVADYRHVHEGPGVILVGHQANYSLDNTGGRLGLRYRRNDALPGDNHDRLRQALGALLGAAGRLEDTPDFGGALRFDRREVEIAINDRLLAPNRPETREAVLAELRLFFARACGGAEAFALDYRPDPRGLLSFTLRAAQPLELKTLPGGPAAPIATPPRDAPSPARLPADGGL